MNNQGKRKIWFVRHAQSEYNKKQLFTGWHDPDLTEKGIDAAKELNFLEAARLRDLIDIYKKSG